LLIIRSWRIEWCYKKGQASGNNFRQRHNFWNYNPLYYLHL